MMDFIHQHRLEHLLSLRKEQVSHSVCTLGTFVELKEMVRNPEESVWVQVSCTPLAAALVCTLRVQTTLRVVCQRCLEPMDVPVKQDTTWALTQSGIPAKGMNKDIEYLAYSDYTGILDMISQELVLAVPMVVRHALGTCQVKGTLATVQSDTAGYGSQNRSSVFDVLQTLKR